MNKSHSHINSKPALALTSEEIRELIATCTKTELMTVLKAAKKDSKNIRAREDIYVSKVPDEILKKPFEIVT